MPIVTFCPHCRGTDIYHKQVTARDDSMDLLPGVGEWFDYGEFDLYVCADCGHVQFFVRDHLDKVRENWEKVETRLMRHE